MIMSCDELKRLTQSIVPFLYIKLNTESFPVRGTDWAYAGGWSSQKVDMSAYILCVLTSAFWQREESNLTQRDTEPSTVSPLKKFF